MSARLNKSEIILVNTGKGTIEFQVPSIKKAEDARLKLRYASRPSGGNTKKQGKTAFHKNILLDGFRAHGSISIDGWLHMPAGDDDKHPDFRTMVQMDGDIICKIGAPLFRKNQWEEMIRGYELVRSRFLDEFAKAVRAWVLKLTACIGAVGFFGGIAWYYEQIMQYLF